MRTRRDGFFEGELLAATPDMNSFSHYTYEDCFAGILSLI